MYRVTEGAGEVAAATHLVTDSAERLRRLRRAYGAWQEFESGPYFDLTGPQLAMLVQVQERMTTVHVALTLDLLLPSVQAVAGWYLEQWQPIAGASAATQLMRADEWPAIHDEMQRRWQQACVTIHAVRMALHRSAAYWGFNHAAGERARWPLAANGQSTAWQPGLAVAPTLTLALEFALPAARQPGRLRRLRRMWRGQWQGSLE